jgi:outer membrane protein OmpA-like peptidoglycan-associated protein
MSDGIMTPRPGPAIPARRMTARLGVLLVAAVCGCARLGMPGVGPCAPYLVGGAVLGAEAGAMTGSGAKERRQRAAVGAAAGAAAGYTVCVRAWRQKAALEAQFAAVDSAGGGGTAADPAARVVRSVEVVDNREIRLELNLTFATGQSELPQRAAAPLDALGSSLLQFSESRVLVAGHTDNVGDPIRNRLLSRQRAEAVAAWLVARGVNASRLQVQGMGSDAPLADNATAEGRARNRRVEITIRPTVPVAE